MNLNLFFRNFIKSFQGEYIWAPQTFDHFVPISPQPNCVVLFANTLRCDFLKFHFDHSYAKLHFIVKTKHKTLIGWFIEFR